MIEINQDKNKPEEIFDISDDTDAEEIFDLAWRYDQGESIEQDHKKAFELYLKAANLNHEYAQNNVALMYEDGIGVTKNIEEAIRWYRKAAQQGNSDSQCNLGRLYQYGIGLRKNYKLAMRWYKKAIEQDNSFALFNLGLMHLYGSGVEQDLEKAKQFFSSAASDPTLRATAIEHRDKAERYELSPKITDIRDEILTKLKVDNDIIPTMTHYTSLATGHSLLLEESPLRLGHINAVNDPNEGKLLWRIIEQEQIEGNPVFIGCFLPDHDSLNMWRFYSKNHHNEDACGCAITFQVTDFFDYNLLSKYTNTPTETKTQLLYKNTGEYPQESASFYRIIYIKNDGKPVGDSNSTSYFEKTFDELKHAAKKFLGETPTNERLQQLANLLGPLPYLLKDADYKDEQEHRIIVTHLEYGAKEIQCVKPDLDKGIPPRLYLELHRKNHLKPIRHITLGPKSPYKEMMAPYWHHQLAMNFSAQLDGRDDFYIRASKCSYK